VHDAKSRRRDELPLQVIQVMYDKPPYTIPGNEMYYQCADLILVRPPEPDAGVDQDAGMVERDGGAPRDGGSTEDIAAEGGCACSTPRIVDRFRARYIMTWSFALSCWLIRWRRRPGSARE
jgi:hypothetical protein